MKAIILMLLSAILPALAGALDGLQPGHWRELTNTHLRSVVPSPHPAGDPTAIMTAWSGGAYDHTREQLIVWGGGHVDYAGNELYTFGPMTSNTPAWTRRTNPSTADQDCGASYPDGKPASTHTYGNLVYAPNVEKFYTMGLGSNYPCGSENGQIWSMNLTNYSWDAQSTNPNFGGNVQGGFSAYDSKTGYIWTRPFGSSPLRCFNPATHNMVGTYSDGQYLEIYGIGAIDPVRHIMVSIGGYSSGQPTFCWRLDTPGSVFKPVTTGDKSPETGSNRGFEYHAPSGMFVAWFGGSSVYTLKLPTNWQTGSWTWTKVTPLSGNTVTPTASVSAGTYGRFRYIPSLDVFMVVNGIDQNVYAYKLDAPGTGVAAPASRPVSGALFQAAPNPFKGETSLSFELSQTQSVELSIFTASGAKVATLVNGTQAAGLHRVMWKAPAMQSGFFIARMKAGNRSSSGEVMVKKLFILK